MGIERPACPIRQFFMFGLAWIADCAEEVVVSGKAADVFGRASADYFDKPWIEVSGCRVADDRGFDQMDPVISEVVDIADLVFSCGVDDVSEAGCWVCGASGGSGGQAAVV